MFSGTGGRLGDTWGGEMGVSAAAAVRELWDLDGDIVNVPSSSDFSIFAVWPGVILPIIL